MKGEIHRTDGHIFLCFCSTVGEGGVSRFSKPVENNWPVHYILATFGAFVLDPSRFASRLVELAPGEIDHLPFLNTRTASRCPQRS